MEKVSINPNLFSVFMGFVGFVAIMAATMYLPLFPEMMKEFGTDRTTLKLSITVLFLGVGLGQVIAGPFSDVYGKHRVLIIFSVLFVLSSLACAQCQDGTTFLYARFFQGLGTAAAPPIVRALVAEDFRNQTYFKVIASISFLYSIAPGASPFIGSFIGHVFQWPVIFYVLSGLGLISLVIAIVFRYETVAPGGTLKEIYRDAWGILKNRRFMGYGTLNMICFSELFIFATLSVFLFRIHYGWSIRDFSWVGFSIAVGAAGGALLMRFLVSHIPTRKLLLVGIFVMMASVLYLFTINALGEANGTWVLGGVILYFIGSGLVTSVSTGHALMEVPKSKGVASSILGVLAVLAITSGTGVAALIDDSLLNVALVLLVAPLASAGLYWLLRDKS